MTSDMNYINNSFSVTIYQLTHGPVLVHRPGVGGHWFIGHSKMAEGLNGLKPLFEQTAVMLTVSLICECSEQMDGRMLFSLKTMSALER